MAATAKKATVTPINQGKTGKTTTTKKAAKKTAPVPSPGKPVAAVTVVKPTAVMELGQVGDADIRQALKEYAEESETLKAQKKAAEARLEGDKKKGIPGLNAEFAELLAATNIKTLTHNGKRHTYTEGTNTSLSKDLLLANGVPADVIAKSYKSTTYQTVTTTEEKEGVTEE